MWYHKSAEQGNSVANFNLGMAYELERGTGQDLDKALAFFQKSLELGYAPAESRVARVEATLHSREQSIDS